MSALVFWQELGDNYVRAGTMIGRSDKMYTFDVKRWGTVETVADELVKVIG